MKLMTKPQSVNGVRKKSRSILEKFKDLYSQRKFQKVISKSNISSRQGKDADIQVCIDYVMQIYNCFLFDQSRLPDYPNRKHEILFNNLITLDQKISDAVKNDRPVPKRYVTNVLKSQTIYFNSLKSKRFNSDCSDQYDKFVLSAISVWNNDWHSSN